MEYFIAEIEDDNFEIILAENKEEVIKELEKEGHEVLDVNKYID